MAEVDRLLEAGALAKAEQTMAAPLALMPQHPSIIRRLALVHQRMGRHAEAVKEYEGLLVGNPDDPAILSELAMAQADTGNLTGAVASLKRCCELAPVAKSWFQLGVMHDRSGDHDAALFMADRCLMAEPGHTLAGFLRARNLQALGSISAAARQYRDLIAGGRQVANAWFGLLDLKTVTLEVAELEALRAFVSEPRLNIDERIKAGFALGLACDRAAHHDEAFAAFEKANESMRKNSHWSSRNQRALVDRISVAFGMPPDEDAQSTLGQEVIFVVGLPRSGTTVVEQILAAHSEVEGASELPDLAAIITAESKRRGLEFPEWAPLASPLDWERMGQEYMRRTAKWRGSRPRFTDKALENWLYVGAIRRMLPASRVIAVQRDPVETCWSCYKQLFAPGLVQYSYDFADLALYWGDYSELCRLWARQPDRFRLQPLERIQNEPVAEIADILGFCGLRFEQQCLNSHKAARAVRTASSAQVREPLKRSSAQADLYESRLDGLRHMLARPRESTLAG